MQYALLLLDQGRFKSAELELRKVLSQNPENGEAHAYLTLALLGQKRNKEAGIEVKKAMETDPENPYFLYLLAYTEYSLRNYKKADEALQKAVAFDPTQADYYYLAGTLAQVKSDWKSALSYADKGLSVNPESTSCTLLKADVLVKLGRRKEADDLVYSVLRQNPENEDALLSKGWICLEESNPGKALEFFSEAARINPESEGAKQGIVTALKAKNFIYRMVFYYYLFMSKLTGKAQWVILIGLYLLMRVLRSAAKSNPEIAPFVNPVLGIYIGFIFLSWAADPFFNLFIRLHPLGKYALSTNEKTASNGIVVTLLLALLCVIGFVLMKDQSFIMGALGFLFLVIPIAGTLGRGSSSQKNILIAYTSLLVVALIGGIILSITGSPLGMTVFIGFMIGIFVYTILANMLTAGSAA